MSTPPTMSEIQSDSRQRGRHDQTGLSGVSRAAEPQSKRIRSTLKALSWTGIRLRPSLPSLIGRICLSRGAATGRKVYDFWPKEFV